jgi:hypothetical protein
LFLRRSDYVPLETNGIVTGLRAERSGVRITVGTKVLLFLKRPDGPLGPHTLLFNVYRVSFPGVKRPEPGVAWTHLRLLCKCVEQHLHSSSVLAWPVTRRLLC